MNQRRKRRGGQVINTAWGALVGFVIWVDELQSMYHNGYTIEWMMGNCSGRTKRKRRDKDNSPPLLSE